MWGHNLSLFLALFLAASSHHHPCLAQTTPDGGEYSIMEISFPTHDGMQLEGTLRVPCLGCTSSPQPGVVLVHGSGPQSRDAVATISQWGLSIPIFEEIAEALVESGIAVLTYDKRSCGTFNGCSNNSYPLPSNNTSVDDFIADASAAVDYLQSREDIEGVVVAGHSQAGQFVPILLEEKPELLGGVLLAGPYHTIDVVIRDQVNFSFQTLVDLGNNESTVHAHLQPLFDFIEGIEAVKNGSTTKSPPNGGLSAAFFQSWFDVAPRAVEAAAEIDQPLLLINGLLDTNIFPSEAKAWDTYLEQIGAKYQLELLPCITHALNCVNATSLFNVPDEQIGRHVDSRVTTSISNFVYSAVAAKQAASQMDSTSAETTSGDGLSSAAGIPYWFCLILISVVVVVV